jgi:hypothetical protein
VPIINLIENLNDYIGSKVPFGMDSGELVNLNLNIEQVSDSEADSIMLDAVKYLLKNQLKSGLEYKQKWEIGWKENLDAYIATKQELDLVPKYITKNNVFRVDGHFFRSSNPYFEIDFARLILLHTVTKYLNKSDTIVDIGCGSCHYTLWLAKKLQSLRFFALDWVQSSMKIADLISKDFSLDIKPIQFDMFNPKIIDFGSKNKIAISIGALEQLGTDFDNILLWYKESEFETIINIEPIVEFYDENIIFDFLAKEYVLKRNWLNGYLTKIQNLCNNGEVEIIEKRRVFGSKFHETYNVLVWRFIK